MTRKPAYEESERKVKELEKEALAHKKAEEALERPVSVEIGMEMWDPTMMEEGAGADWGLF